MRKSAISSIGSLLLASIVCGSPVLADTLFTIEDPPVDFEVIDAEPFDGIGDNGPYATFNDALLGTVGEARSMAEFDISPFSVPPGESISSATFEVRITDIDIFGLGVDGETPSSLLADGYVGNGVAELSDFQAGDGNTLDSVATPDPQIGQVISFDVTSFVTALVVAGESYVGLTLRAGSFGGLMAEEGAGYPKLTIETVLEPTAVEPFDPPVTPILVGNSPNPFAASTRIEYRVPAESGGPVVLTIHDAAGRLIDTLLDASQPPGTHSALWRGTNEAGEPVPAGVYFCRLWWNGRSESQRLVLSR
jgi:hypothetical protein